MPHSPFEPDRRLFPFESRWFQSHVGQVHYVDEGSGPPILFLHGNPTWSFLYRGVILRLRDRFRCIAPDYPGFGLSPHPRSFGYTAGEHAAVVRELVNSLGLDDLTLMGQDWGGPIGLRVAADHPRRIRALVMGNTWYWPTDAWHVKAFSWALSSEMGQRWIVEKNGFVERILPTGVLQKMNDEVLDHYRGPFPTPDSRAGVAEFPAQLTRASRWLGELARDVPDRLGDRPLLLTWGMKDFAFPPSFMNRWREDFSRVTIRRLQARHFIQEDCPQEIAAAIGEFLGGE